MSEIKRKKKEVVKEETENQVDSINGRYQLKKGHGKHYIHSNPLCNIQGKKNKRVVEEGNILICPPYLIENFKDKFICLSSPAESIEEKEKIEVEKSKPKVEHKGGGKYNVISAAGVKLNDRFLTKTEAEELLEIEIEDEKE